MNRFNFVVRYENQTCGVVVNGVAHVIGDYDGPSKPEAMIRAALAGAADEASLVRVIPTDGPRPEEVVVPK